MARRRQSAPRAAPCGWRGRSRAQRAARSLGGWLLLSGWLVLPLLPVLGLGLTSLLGLS